MYFGLDFGGPRSSAYLRRARSCLARSLPQSGPGGLPVETVWTLLRHTLPRAQRRFLTFPLITVKADSHADLDRTQLRSAGGRRHSPVAYDQHLAPPEDYRVVVCVDKDAMLDRPQAVLAGTTLATLDEPHCRCSKQKCTCPRLCACSTCRRQKSPLQTCQTIKDGQ